MGGNITDIVITSRNRLPYLTKTLEFLVARTRTPHAIHVIDDNSGYDVTDYLKQQWHDGTISSLVLRNERAGIHANKNLSVWLALSDPFVITADDILCPDLDPDWLARGLDAMSRHPEVGELDLNHPGAFRVVQERLADITYCECVGGTLGFLRRGVFIKWCHAHFRGNYGVGDDVQRCGHIRSFGGKVAFLNDVFCYHIGRKSAATGGEYANSSFIEPLDWKTLEPPDEFKS